MLLVRLLHQLPKESQVLLPEGAQAREREMEEVVLLGGKMEEGQRGDVKRWGFDFQLCSIPSSSCFCLRARRLPSHTTALYTMRYTLTLYGLSSHVIPEMLNSSLQDEASRKPEMKLSVPEILKVKLVDDWEAVTKNNQVCNLVTFVWPMLLSNTR